LKRCAVFKQDPQLESGLTLFEAKVMLEYLNVYICSTKKWCSHISNLPSTCFILVEHSISSRNIPKKLTLSYHSEVSAFLDFIYLYIKLVEKQL
jgi:hypothetical protein